jgi:hypothetical protein
VRKIAVNTSLYPDSVPILHGIITGTIHVIEGTIAEKTVQFLKPLMAGIIFAFPVFKKSA